MARQQFNVTLDADLVRRIKHHAIDAQLSLADLVHQVFSHHLSQEDPMTDPIPAAGLKLQPMVHVEDMAAAVTFYEALGASVRQGSRDGDFVLLELGDSQFSLLAHPPNPEQNEGQVELNFETAEALGELEERLRARGVSVAQPASDEAFGAQLQVRAPDGLLIKINSLEPELFG